MATAATVFRDYETDGVPSSGAKKPKKSEIRQLLGGYESIINAFLSNGGLIFASKASLDASLNYAANTMAWVLGDATVANNGIYRKIGGSGTGSWTRVSDLPFSFIIASDAGAGTANAIQATTSIPVSGSALVWMNVFEANTASPVTVSFNGGTALTIKTNTGNDPVVGGLVSGMIVMGIVSGSTFRLISDQASSAIVAAAEAAQAAAEAAAASINHRIYASRALAMADTLPPTVQRLRTQFNTPDYLQPKTLVGGANWRRVSFAALAGYPTQAYFRSADRFMPDGTVDNTNGGYWVIDESIIYGEMLGAVLDGVVDCTAAMNAAVAVQGLRGGGEIRLGVGTALLTNSNPGAGSWDNRRCIYVNYDDITLRFSKGTVLKLANNANAHVIKIGSRVEGTVVVSNVLIEGGEIDGNRSNQVTPTITDDHNNGIDISTGCQKVTIRDMHIHHTMYYGIGFQSSGFKNCTVDNVLIEDTNADGIDMKDTSYDSIGNVCRAVRVRRFGGFSELTPQAGINPRTGWTLVAVEVTDYAGDLHGIRVDAANAANNGIPTKILGFHCEPSAEDTTVGLMLNVVTVSTDVEPIVEGGTVRGAKHGVYNRFRFAKVSDVIARNCEIGFYFYGDSQGSNLAARGCDKGFYVEGNTNVFSNVSAYSCGVGLEVQSGGTLNSFRHGVFSGNTTNVVDNGTQTAISHIAGVNTHSVGTANVPIDSTGTKGVTIAHSLDFTPSIDDVLLSFKRNTNVGDFSLGFYWVYQVDATNIYCNVRVLTASATAGATVTLVANCVAKKALRQ